MVEGHFFPMQQHLHSQSGSSRSCDVLELACRVVVQIAKVRGGKAQFLRVRNQSARIRPENLKRQQLLPNILPEGHVQNRKS